MKLKMNQNGQSILEYIILTSLIGVFCLMAFKDYGKVLQERIENMKSHVVKNITLYRTN